MPFTDRIVDARIAAVCDVDEDRRRETAERYGVEERYADYEAMVADHDLEFEMDGRRISTYGDIHDSAGTDELGVQADDVDYAESERIPLEDTIESTEASTRVDGAYQVNHHFVDCLRNGRDSDVAFEDTVGSMEVKEAINEGERLPTHFCE